MDQTIMSKNNRINNTGASDQVIRPEAPAVDAFIDALAEEVRNDPEGKLRRVSFESLEELVDATQDYYERAVSAESKSRANLIVGLIGGAAITAGTFGIFSLARRRRNQRRNGNK